MNAFVGVRVRLSSGPIRRSIASIEKLTSYLPEIDSIPDKQVDDKDACPWSSALDRSDVHVLISSLWPKAEEVYSFVQQLAQKHDLVFYDPQSGEVRAPEPSTGHAQDFWS